MTDFTKADTPANPTRTAALGLFIIIVLFPAGTMAMLASPWLGLVTGLVFVTIATFIRTDRGLVAPRLLCGVFGLLAIAWSIWMLVVT